MQQEQNKMATAPVGRLLLTMGTPIILSMALQAVYNIVDSAFVSHIAQNGEAALNALTLAFPIQMLMVAVAVGTGVGTNALMARLLGQQDYKKASLAAGNGLFLACVITLVFILFGLTGVPAYIGTQTNNPLIFDYAVDYLRICCVLCFGIVFFTILEKLLQATGRSTHSAAAQISGAVTNMVLDPVMIFGLLGFPACGVKGAAYATVIGQMVSMGLALFFHLKYNQEIDPRPRYMKPSKSVIQKIYAIGLPAIIAQALMSVMTYALNIIFVQIDESMVTAYGLYYKIQQFVLFCAFGLRDAITPIVSFNQGMRSRERVMAGIRYGLIDTTVLMTVSLIVLELFATRFASVFGLSGKTLALFIDAIHLVSLSFVFAGANIAFQGIYQALDSGLASFILSVCRQFLFVIPVAWGFSRIAIAAPEKTSLVWTTFPIAEGLTLIIAIVLMRRIDKTKIKPVP